MIEFRDAEELGFGEMEDIKTSKVKLENWKLVDSRVIHLPLFFPHTRTYDCRSGKRMTKQPQIKVRKAIKERDLTTLLSVLPLAHSIGLRPLVDESIALLRQFSVAPPASVLNQAVGCCIPLNRAMNKVEKANTTTFFNSCRRAFITTTGKSRNRC